MPITYTTKEDPNNPNVVIIEQCIPEKWCGALSTFLEHMGQQRIGLESAYLWSMREQKESERLIYRMPRKLGNFIILNFCPFCGGAVKEEDQTLINVETNQPQKVTIRYEPF